MRRALPPLLLVSLLAACGGSGGNPEALPTTPGAAPSSSPTTTAGETTRPVPTASPTAGGARPGAVATDSPSVASTRGGAAPAPSETGTPPGTYTYDYSGTQTVGGSRKDISGTAELVITPLRQGRQTGTLQGSQGETVQELLVRSDGSYLERLTVRGPGMPEQQLAPEPAALLLPVPARVGRTWSWQATSSDGSTTATADNRVLRTETVTIGGRAVATVVLQTHLVLSGDVDYTADITTWVMPDLRLPVKDHTVAEGTAIGLPFTSDVTNVLRTTRPS